LQAQHQERSGVNAMVLAAGRGTRLGEISKATPKVLVPVAGQPVLGRQIRYLKDSGVERIVVNAHHLASQIERFVATHDYAEDIEVVLEQELLGTAGGVINALPLLGEDDFLVLYGDVLVDEPIERMRATHAQLGGACTIAVYRTDDVLGKGTVEVDEGNDAVVGFREKAVSRIEGEAYVNAGVYLMRPAFLSELPVGVPLDFGHDVFPRALARKEGMFVHLLEEPVIDMGTPAALDLARLRRR
jgi:mannose-1-phosphate guanylyltransferase